MALTGVQIFKYLPKTNCKKCGHPTCLAFAMKLAARQANIDDCPDISAEARAVLGEASAPPIRPITLGAGDKAVKVGEETVLYRHDKKFVNPSAYAIALKDTASEADAKALVDAVRKSEMERVGQMLRINAIFISNTSGNAGSFESMAKLVAAEGADIPVILSTKDAAAASAALKHFAGKGAMLHGADASNMAAMAAAAKEAKASLVVCGNGLDEVSDLTEKAKAAGCEDLVIDSGACKAKDILEHNVYARRAALNKGFKPLGYPILTFAIRDNNYLESLIAVLSVAKYSSIIVLSSIEKWKNLALYALRQNIYTDPQVPMQVQQKVYNLGDVTNNSPLMITTNFSLTYFIVAGEVENSKVPTRLAVMDCEGLSVLTAWAAGKFTASKIAQFIKESGVENELTNKELIIPGYVAILSGALEDKLEGWKITVGPREANAIPAYLKGR